jgi:hypothetical protein
MASQGLCLLAFAPVRTCDHVGLNAAKLDKSVAFAGRTHILVPFRILAGNPPDRAAREETPAAHRIAGE